MESKSSSLTHKIVFLCLAPVLWGVSCDIAFSKGLFGASKIVREAEEARVIVKEVSFVKKLFDAFVKSQINKGLRTITYREVVYKICQEPSFRQSAINSITNGLLKAGFNVDSAQLDKLAAVAIACFDPSYNPINPDIENDNNKPKNSKIIHIKKDLEAKESNFDENLYNKDVASNLNWSSWGRGKCNVDEKMHIIRKNNTITGEWRKGRIYPEKTLDLISSGFNKYIYDELDEGTELTVIGDELEQTYPKNWACLVQVDKSNKVGLVLKTELVPDL